MLHLCLYETCSINFFSSANRDGVCVILFLHEWVSWGYVRLCRRVSRSLYRGRYWDSTSRKERQKINSTASYCTTPVWALLPKIRPGDTRSKKERKWFKCVTSDCLYSFSEMKSTKQEMLPLLLCLMRWLLYLAMCHIIFRKYSGFLSTLWPKGKLWAHTWNLNRKTKHKKKKSEKTEIDWSHLDIYILR